MGHELRDRPACLCSDSGAGELAAKAFAVSQRWPAVVQPFALDVSDLLLAYSETGRDVLPGLNHAHVVVLGVHQGHEHFLALVLGQGSVDHGGMPSGERATWGCLAYSHSVAAAGSKAISAVSTSASSCRRCLR